MIFFLRGILVNATFSSCFSHRFATFGRSTKAFTNDLEGRLRPYGSPVPAWSGGLLAAQFFFFGSSGHRETSVGVRWFLLRRLAFAGCFSSLVVFLFGDFGVDF